MRMVPLHPVLEAAFFVAVLVTTIVWSHPVYLAISYACALAYALKLAGRRAGARAAVLVALASAVLFGVLFDWTRMLCTPELLMNPLTPASSSSSQPMQRSARCRSHINWAPRRC